jgi:hypothetical protein
MRERIEELERMREHVFKEADTNKDGLIRWERCISHIILKSVCYSTFWEF